MFTNCKGQRVVLDFNTGASLDLLSAPATKLTSTCERGLSSDTSLLQTKIKLPVREKVRSTNQVDGTWHKALAAVETKGWKYRGRRTSQWAVSQCRGTETTSFCVFHAWGLICWKSCGKRGKIFWITRLRIQTEQKQAVEVGVGSLATSRWGGLSSRWINVPGSVSVCGIQIQGLNVRPTPLQQRWMTGSSKPKQTLKKELCVNVCRRFCCRHVF